MMKAVKPPVVTGHLRQDHDGYLFHVISNCSRLLGLRGLARVAASSKQLGQSCTTIIHRDALQLATADIKAAEEYAAALQDSKATIITWAWDEPKPSAEESAMHAAQQQHLQDLVRLTHLQPHVAAAEHVVNRLLHIPKVPGHIAKQLVAAGVRIPYAQLLSAANSMVEDLEVWVQAQQQLGVKTDIPKAAVAVCCGTFDFYTGRVNTTDAAA
jgi:hypothetical protein